MKNILMIGAHYDDVELGMGGAALKLVNQGCNVYKLTLTDNQVEESFFNKETNGQQGLLQSRKACSLLGMTQVEQFTTQSTCGLTYTTKYMQQIEKVIIDLKIDTVFSHSEFDMNQDHAAAGKLCKVASRHCDTLFTYQSNMYVNSAPFYPTVFFDITKYINLKKEVLAQYGVEHHRFSAENDGLFENVINRNKVWGFQNGVLYAEGFIPYKMLL